MILGIGIDIVEVKRIKHSIERFSDRFLGRVFSPTEIEYCDQKANPAVHFAARFAAKEAVVKSMGTGFTRGIQWADVEVVNSREGRPTVRLLHEADKVFKEMGGDLMHLSITHTTRYATALAVCEKIT